MGDFVEVKKSRNNENIEYVDSKILSDKKSVYSIAKFDRITTGKNIKLSLKVGRYKKQKIGGAFYRSNELENDMPKSSLSLNDEELKSLVEYIDENYYPLNNNETKYVSLNSNEKYEFFKKDLNEMLEFIKRAVKEGLDISDINSTIEFSKRKRALKVFAENMKNEVTEHVWQKWFTNNCWVLGNDFVMPLDISQDRRIDVDNITDFIVENLDGYVDVIEIKRPTDDNKFFDETKDHSNLIPHKKLVAAITQLASYLNELETKADSNNTTRRIGRILKPRGILIYGRSKKWGEEELKAYRLLNANLSNILIYTYDMVFVRAKKLCDFTDEK